MSKKESPFAQRFKRVDGGKSSTIASAWDDLIKKKKDEVEPESYLKSTATETEDMIKISLWVPKEIKNDIDIFVDKLKNNPLSKPFAKPSVIIRESIELGYPKIKDKITNLFAK